MPNRHLQEAALQPLSLLVLLGGLPLLCSAASPKQAPANMVSRTAPASSASALEAQATKGPGLYAVTPERRAALETIRYAEGTWSGGSTLGYRILYGGGTFGSFERHPDTVVVRRYASAAAGAYQFLPGTWEAANRKLGLSGFGPASQDQAALHLIESRGALADVDRGQLTDRAINRLAQEWASFPTASGVSAYGQPSKTVQQLRAFHRAALRRHQIRTQGEPA
jgi:muramidase (phage lysozyme)